MKGSILLNLLLVLSVGSIAQIDSKPLQLKLDSIFSKFKENEPGGCIHIQQGDQLLYTRSFGMANVATKQKFDDYTLSNIGEISRTFIAYEFQILKAENKIKYEDSLSLFYTNEQCKTLTNQIKYWHLLSHSSGLAPLKFSSNKSKTELFKNCKVPLFTPGSNYLFNPQAFDLLIPILDSITHKPWTEYIKQHILSPSGMTFTKFSSHNYPSANHAKAYLYSKNKFSEQSIKGLSVLNANNDEIMWSNIVDLRKYLNAIQYCLFLDCELMNATRSPAVPLNWSQPFSPPHGSVWKLKTNNDPNKDSYFFYDSQIGSYHAYMACVPSKNIQIIYLSNRSSEPAKQAMKALVQLGYLDL